MMPCVFASQFNLNCPGVLPVPKNFTIPVPFGSKSRSPFELVVEISFPLRSKLSTFKLSSFLLASAINAELAVRVPGA